MDNKNKLLNALSDKEWDIYFNMLLNPNLRDLAIAKLVKQKKLNELNSLNESFLEKIFFRESMPYLISCLLLHHGADYYPLVCKLISDNNTSALGNLLSVSLIQIKLPSTLNLAKLPLSEMLPLLEKQMGQADLNEVFFIGKKLTFLFMFLLFCSKKKPDYPPSDLKYFYQLLEKHQLNFNYVFEEDSENYLMKAIKLEVDNFHIITLMKYIDVSSIMSTGYCAVSFAIMQKNSIIALKLIDEIKEGAFFNNRRMKLGTNLLHLAIMFKQEEIALKIISHKDTDLNLPTGQKRQSPLYLACYHELVDVCDALLKKEVDIFAVNHLGLSALHIACKKNNFAIVSKLLAYAEKKYDPSTFQKWINLLSPLISPPESIEKPIELETFTRGQQIAEGYTALHFACQQTKTPTEKNKIAELLLKKGAFASYHDILVVALSNNDALKIQLLNNFTKQGTFSKNALHYFIDKPFLSTPFMEGEKGQSSFSALKEQGFFSSEIKEMQKETKSKFEEWINQLNQSSNNNNDFTTGVNLQTTFLKKIPINETIPITRGTPNCFSSFYLPKKTEEELEPFKRVAHQFAASEEEYGLKKLTGDFFTQIKSGNEIIEVKITHEVKINGPKRVYCVEIPSDQKNRATLYLGLIYDEKGLHTAKQEELLFAQKHKIYMVDLPDLETQHSIYKM